MPSLELRHVRLLIGVAVVSAFAVGLAATPHPRITPDSASYLTGAERIAESGRFESCTGAITLFAPGFSAAMAPLVASGLDATDAARLINVLAALALVVGACFLARSSGLSQRTSFVVAIAVAVSYATLRDGALVWSEPLFCAILAWLLVLLVDEGKGLEVRPTPKVVGVVTLVWALLLTRHSGVFLLPAVLVAAWMGSSGSTRRSARIAVLGVVLLAVPAVWWARDVHVDAAPFGRRSGSPYDALEVLRQLPDGLSSLVLPHAMPYALRLAITIPLAVAAALAWRRLGAPRHRIAVAVLTTATVVYAGAVTLAATHTVVDRIDTRLMSPVLVPAAVLVALGVTARRTRIERALGGFALFVVLGAAVIAPGVVWQGHGAERTLANIPEDTSCAHWPARYSAGSAERFAGDDG